MGNEMGVLDVAHAQVCFWGIPKVALLKMRFMVNRLHGWSIPRQAHIEYWEDSDS